MAHSIMTAKRTLLLVGAVGVLGLSGVAQAQTTNTNSSAYNAGYGRVSGQENRAVNPTMRDVNGNLVIVDGMIQSGQDQSVFAGANVGGAVDTFAGVGASGGASAIGNNLVVVTQGNYNTVIVNSNQTNSGNVSASSTVSGGVGNAH